MCLRKKIRGADVVKRSGVTSPSLKSNRLRFKSNQTEFTRSVRAIKVIHTHTCTHVRPIHTTDGSLFSTAPPGHAGASVTPPNLLPQNTTLTLLIANPGPRLSSSPVLIDWGTVCGRHNNIQNPNCKRMVRSPCSPLRHKSAAPSDTVAAKIKFRLTTTKTK